MVNHLKNNLPTWSIENSSSFRLFRQYLPLSPRWGHIPWPRRPKRAFRLYHLWFGRYAWLSRRSLTRPPLTTSSIRLSYHSHSSCTQTFERWFRQFWLHRCHGWIKFIKYPNSKLPFNGLLSRRRAGIFVPWFWRTSRFSQRSWPVLRRYVGVWRGVSNCQSLRGTFFGVLNKGT